MLITGFCDANMQLGVDTVQYVAQDLSNSWRTGSWTSKCSKFSWGKAEQKEAWDLPPSKDVHVNAVSSVCSLCATGVVEISWCFCLPIDCQIAAMIWKRWCWLWSQGRGVSPFLVSLSSILVRLKEHKNSCMIFSRLLYISVETQFMAVFWISLRTKMTQDICSGQQANLATILVGFFLQVSVWRLKNLLQGCLNGGNLLPSGSKDVSTTVAWKDQAMSRLFSLSTTLAPCFSSC